MPTFSAGDRVTIDGRPGIVRSWPDNNTGPYVIDVGTPTHPHYINGIAGVPKKKDDAYTPADVVLVERAAGPIVSTAGSLDGLDISW